MNPCEIMIALLIGALLLLVFLLRGAAKRSDQWQAMWTRDTKELLHWKRYATLRDPKTGKYIKKDKRK